MRRCRFFEARHRSTKRGVGSAPSKRGVVTAGPGASHPDLGKVKRSIAASVSPAENAASAMASWSPLWARSWKVMPSTYCITAYGGRPVDALGLGVEYIGNRDGS